MNRELKFRAWNINPETRIGTFIYIDLLDISLQGYYALQNLEEFQQYTGIKDKNGVEIYEGDIVKFHTQEDFSPFVVCWRGVAFDFGINPLLENKEVIGNIYENGDLLK